MSQFKGWENQEPRVLDAIEDFGLDYCYEAKQSQYQIIEGSPISYWLSDSVYSAFLKSDKVIDFGTPRQGLITGDNNIYMRLWFEVDINKIDFECKKSGESDKKWFPHSKGGAVRRWYGNNDYIVNWENGGYELKNFKNQNGKLRSRPQNEASYFKSGITWSDLTISWFSARFVPDGFIFDGCGPTLIPNSKDELMYLCGYFNSWVFQEFLNITCQGMHYSNGVIAQLPIIYDKTKNDIISKLVKSNISISKADWDEDETSWDFRRHVLCLQDRSGLISDEIKKYCDKKKANYELLERQEQELDNIFAGIFDMKNVIPSKGICPPTIEIRDERKLVITLISYAVGCMFGRYSLDYDGIVYGGGEWSKLEKSSFEIDADGIIPITDMDYFQDDILSRFISFIDLVYGNEYLEENLTFIAKVLGDKGKSPRETLRQYFVNDFYKDHCNIYSVPGSGKRPIYWLFDSGKQNGFKCLIYMHRYNKDTLNLIRSKYLHKTEDAVENALKNAEYIIQTSASAVERAKATKDRNRYVKQLNEMRIYYQALSHLALQKIEIDLDDGVKHNYQLFQGIEVIADGGKKQKVDLLAKI